MENAVVIMRDFVDTHSTGLLELSKTSGGYTGKEEACQARERCQLQASLLHFAVLQLDRVGILKCASLLLCCDLSKSLSSPVLLRSDVATDLTRYGFLHERVDGCSAVGVALDTFASHMADGYLPLRASIRNEVLSPD